MAKRVNIANVGLRFGAEFIPIYQTHPNANLVTVCQRDRKKPLAIQKAFGVEKGYTSYDELLKDPEIDAVHIKPPISDHAEQSLHGLRAGKHVACTVPMAPSIGGCRRIFNLPRTHHPFHLQYGAPVSRVDRRVWIEKVVRVDTLRKRAACAAYREETGAENTRKYHVSLFCEAPARGIRQS